MTTNEKLVPARIAESGTKNAVILFLYVVRKPATEEFYWGTP